MRIRRIVPTVLLAAMVCIPYVFLASQGGSPAAA
nr:hypothetical protein [Streptomyces cacaoi]